MKKALAIALGLAVVAAAVFTFLMTRNGELVTPEREGTVSLPWDDTRN